MKTTRFETNRCTATEYHVGPGAFVSDRIKESLSNKPAVVVYDERLATLAGRELDAFLSTFADLGALL